MYYLITIDLLKDFYLTLGIDITSFTMYEQTMIWIVSNIFILLFIIFFISFIYKVICRLFR